MQKRPCPGAQPRGLADLLQQRRTLANPTRTLDALISTQLFPWLTPCAQWRGDPRRDVSLQPGSGPVRPTAVRAVHCTQFSPDGACAAVTLATGDVHLLDARSSPCRSQAMYSCEYPTSGSTPPAANGVLFVGEQQLLVGYEDGQIRWWDMRKGSRSKSQLGPCRSVCLGVGHHKGVKNLQLVDQHHVMSSSFDSVNLWDWRSAVTHASAGHWTPRACLFKHPWLLRARLVLPQEHPGLDAPSLAVSLRSGGFVRFHNFALADAAQQLQAELDRAALRADTSDGTPAEPEPVCSWGGIAGDHAYPPIPHMGADGKLLLPRSWCRQRNRLEMSPGEDGFYSSLLSSHGRLLAKGYVHDGMYGHLFDLTRNGLWDTLMDQLDVVHNTEWSQERKSSDPMAPLEVTLRSCIPWQSGMDWERTLRACGLWASLMGEFPDSAAAADVGMIAEPAFSPCGQLLCSPYYNGVRLFRVPTADPLSARTDVAASPALSAQVADAEALPAAAVKLVASVGQRPLVNVNHGTVVSVDFHPMRPQLVCGSLAGDVTFCEPRL